jgi:hypothetical protein
VIFLSQEAQKVGEPVLEVIFSFTAENVKILIFCSVVFVGTLLNKSLINFMFISVEK